MKIKEMQAGLYADQKLLIEYNISVNAGILLNYYEKSSWNPNRIIHNGIEWVNASYGFDISFKNPGLNIAESTFRNAIKELREANLITCIRHKNRLYIAINDRKGYNYQDFRNKFEMFWREYRDINTRGMLKAEMAFRKVYQHFDQIMDGLREYKQSIKDGEFIPRASTWLKNKYWLEEY